MLFPDNEWATFFPLKLSFRPKSELNQIQFYSEVQINFSFKLGLKPFLKTEF